MATKFHVVGNWKMHGSVAQVALFFDEIQEKVRQNPSWLTAVEAVVCPPAIYLAQAAKWVEQISQVKLGAQDVSAYASGAYTGQIAASMLADQQCQYVIVGHSERRHGCHEDNALVAKKFFAAKAAGLIPILCVGETEAERQKGLTDSVVLTQLQAVLEVEGISGFSNAMIAYEPVWAIGTGLTATPEQAQSVHHLLRHTLAEYDASLAELLPILYGGSVKSSNAADLFKMPDIDGALVGGASLQASEFIAICEAAGRLTA